MENKYWLFLNTVFSKIIGTFKFLLHTAGNALAQVQRVHKPADLWDITFCTHWFWGFSYYVHLLILKPRALFYRTDCTCRSKFLTYTKVIDTKQGCILLTSLSVISFKFIQKFAQKCQYFTLIDQNVPPDNCYLHHLFT